MKFYGIEDGAKIEITEPDEDKVLAIATISVTDYLNQPEGVYAGSNEAGLELILTQKYLAFFQNSGQDAYFNFRMTGYPSFDVGPGTGNGGKSLSVGYILCQRRPTMHKIDKAALMRQFGAEVDDLNNDLGKVKLPSSNTFIIL